MLRLPLLVLSLGTLLLMTGLCRAQQNTIPGQNLAPSTQTPTTPQVNTADEAYSALSDDNAGFPAWVAAAREIISYQRPNLDVVRYGPVLNIEDYPIPDHYVPLGESLRSKTNPSVSDLLMKRISNVYISDYYFSPGSSINDVSHLIQDLALWDGKAHLGDLQKYSLYLAKKSPPSSPDLVELYQKRIQLGDSQMMNEYLFAVFPPDRGNSYRNVNDFSVLFTNLDIPAISHFSEQVMAAPNSPLFPIIQLDRNYQNDGLLSTPLFRLAPFRAEVFRELRDTTLIENCTLKEVSEVLTSRLHMTLSYPVFQPQATSAPSNADLGFNLRICDVVASYISKLKGAPDFGFDWPELDRNAAIQQQITFLNQYGDSFEYKDEGNRFATLSFPQLDHPATPDDVTAGRAIFSLTKYNLPTRVIPLGKSPLWGLIKPPATDASSNTANNLGTPVSIWQAEAAFTNGAWHRFYGIVSDHSVRMAPETEIRTALPSEWFINASLQAFLQGSSTFSQGTQTPVVPQIQIPVPLRIVLLNYAPHSVPVPFNLGANPRTLPVSMSMLYTPLPDPSAYQPPLPSWRFRMNPSAGGMTSLKPYFPRAEETAPKSLTLLPLPPASPTPNASPSTPTTPATMIPSYGTVVLTEFDLGSLYDITLPGTYQFSIGDPQQSTNCITYKFIMKE